MNNEYKILGSFEGGEALYAVEPDRITVSAPETTPVTALTTRLEDLGFVGWAPDAPVAGDSPGEVRVIFRPGCK